MCRSIAEGGRRCPCEETTRRRARQNAAYHRKKAQKTDVPTPPAADATGASGSQGTGGGAAPGTPEYVTERVRAAQELLDQTENSPMIETNTPDGFSRTTDHGLRTEQTVREAGEAVHLRAEAIAAEQKAALDQKYGSEEEAGEQLDREFDEAISRTKAIKQDLNERTDELLDQGKTRDEVQRELRPYLDESTEALERAKQALIRRKKMTSEYASMWSQAHREAVAEQRALGPTSPLPFEDRSSKTALAVLDKAHAYYPSEWLEVERNPHCEDQLSLKSGETVTASGQLPLRVQTVSKDARAYYGHRRVVPARVPDDPSRVEYAPGSHSVLKISKLDAPTGTQGVSVALHEYGHRTEVMHPQVNQVCQTFLARRTTTSGDRHSLTGYTASNVSDRAMATESEFQRNRRREWVRPDDFVDQYIGKHYGTDSGHSEVFSMGMESLFSGTHGGLRGSDGYKKDAEHQNLILGILVSVKGREA